MFDLYTNSNPVVSICSMKHQKQPAEVFYETKVFLKILENSQESTCARVSFLIKLQEWACSFIKKETLVQMFSCKFCEILRTPSLQHTSRGLLLKCVEWRKSCVRCSWRNIAMLQKIVFWLLSKKCKHVLRMHRLFLWSNNLLSILMNFFFYFIFGI